MVAENETGAEFYTLELVLPHLPIFFHTIFIYGADVVQIIGKNEY